MTGKSLGFVLLMALLSLFAAACTPPPLPPVPTRIPSTPISTELAPVPTALPAGFNEDNPIQIVIVPADFELATGMESDLKALLEELTDVVLEVIFVETQPEALGLLCNSDLGTVSAAWLNGFAYVGALASECGIPTLQLDRNTDGASDTGEAGVLLLNIEYLETGLTGALASTFCRTSISDIYSWTIPLMMLSSEGIPITDFNAIHEVEDYDALLEGIISGSCAVIGLPQTVWQAYQDSGNIPPDTIIEVENITPSPEFPYHLMVFPFAATLEVIEPITDAFIAIDVASGRGELDEGEATPEVSIEANPEMMQALFGDGFFTRVQASDFNDLAAFLESSGLNLGQLGQ
jgi:ABC-type phosphate/phosphonate transport system substrate-binding protein